MKVLFCTPYLTEEGIVKGGIGVWANNILDYCKAVSSDIEVVPLSYDRRYDVSDKSTTFNRIFYGLRDLWKPIKATKKYMSENKVDVLHLCSSAQLSLYKDLYVLKMAKKKGVKTAIHFHFGRIPELMKANNREAKMIKRVCKAADTVIVMDQRSHDALRAEGFSNVHNLPNPLSMSIIEDVKKMRESITRIENRVMYVGHIIPSKGITELVTACAQVDGIELHLIGTITDEYLKELHNIASAKNNGTWLKYRGKMLHDEVIKEMLAAGVFCLPSYTEGFPNVILESMACGCSIIATPVGAIPEMLQFDNTHNMCGLKVDVKQVDCIKLQLDVIINDKNLRDRYRIKATNRVNELYAVPVVWNQLQNIWKEA